MEPFSSVLVILALFSAVSATSIFNDSKLVTFLSTLEEFETQKNDVVFVLDESGSIGAERFVQVKLFTKFIARRLHVSSEYSRIALLPFASEPRVYSNYIRDSYGNNMCTLVREVDRMDYLAGGTATGPAMVKANELLEQARPDSNKIIVVISDGGHNIGISPVFEAEILKKKGVIIFAVGVADVNREEVEGVATSLNHVYILTDFSYISRLNELLKKASNDINWDTVDDKSLCTGFCGNATDCCDQHASCNCGTQSGSYECACNEGYHGSGHKNDCHKCPKGTYKDIVGNSACKPCPEHSTTLSEGAHTSSQCFCQVGFYQDGKICKAIECARLKAPSGGVLIPSNCSNTYGSQCSLRCQEGYCPHSCGPSDLEPWNRLPLQFRICLETGEWSGEPFHCQAMKCPVTAHPLSGEHNCSGSDFQFGTTCRFTCKEGYELTGSNTRHCLANGSWTGTEAFCKEISCNPLKMNPKLRVKPSACSKKNMKFNSVCQYHCIQGYSLTSKGKVIDGLHTCLANKTWSGVSIDLSCQDTSKPTIECPKSFSVSTDRYKSSAVVKWQEPKAEDNVFISSTTIKEPYFLRKPFTLPIGKTKIVYEAFDTSGLSNTCSFIVTVVDREPPSVSNCPQDIRMYHDSKTETAVQWVEPIFSDNSGSVKIVANNRKSGTKFSWGSSMVHYIAEDDAGNKAYCNFTVTLKRTPCPEIKAPDETSVITCDNYMGGQYCSVFCKEGYHFASSTEVPEKFYCGKDLKSNKFKWKPFISDVKLKFKFPIPDCSRIQKRSAVNASVEMKFNVDTCSKENIDKVRKKFIEILKVEEKKYKGVVCPEEKGCRPENINVTCVSPTKVVKRSIQKDATGKKATLIISFNVPIYPNKTEIKPLKEAEKDNPSIFLLKDFEKQASLSVKNVYHLPQSPSAQVSYDLVPMCSIGQIKMNNSCVTCPAGTYKILDTCVDCPVATYQDTSGNLRCFPCPKGYTTYGKRSKSMDDCKAPCQPGSYSRTTFEPCQLCPLNTYQEYMHGKDCLKCPGGLFTWRVGTNSSMECAEPCGPGSYSDTGLKPCILCSYGSYQNNFQQKVCNPCPENTTTTIEGASESSECKEVDVCHDSGPCLQGSTCVPQQKSYICLCTYGTYGKHCEMTVDPCDQATCSNNGTCKSFAGNYTCLCPEGFEGSSCEINIDDCKQVSCKNGGKCVDLINSYRCECQGGFSGQHCEVNIDDCASNPCLNGGMCTDKIEGFHCCCPLGYSGTVCEEREDLCKSIVCLNGGSCTADDSLAACICPSGFSGKNCEQNIDDCVNYECQNNGSCIDGIHEASCQCPMMYFGKHCESEASPSYYLEFNAPVTTNFVKLENSKVLYAITLSFWMRSNYKENYPTPVSYSYYDSTNDVVVGDGLTLFDINRLILYLHGQMLHTDYIANKDSNWHHYVVTWEIIEGQWSFYVDGKNVVSDSNVGKGKFLYPGFFVLGQEQDSLGGTFSTSEAFAGDITEFNVWDYAMTEEEVKALTLHCGHVGNVIPWVKAVNYLHGTINIHYEVDVCKSIGSCSSNDCHCLFSNRQTDNSCKHSVPSCDPNPCSNNQECISESSRAYCECYPGYEGKFCEIDKNECLLNNGNCSHFCDNYVGSYDCSCPDGMFLSGDGFTCKDTKYCEKDGRIILDGETFKSGCQSCICNQGVLSCQEEECLSIQCSPGEHLITNPGSCCPKCVQYELCVISEDRNKIIAFDSTEIEVPTNCSYKLFEDCTNGLFSVRYEFSDSDSNLYLLDGCTKVQISPTGPILSDGDSDHLPLKNQVVQIESSDGFTEIRSQSGLYIKWQLSGEIAIAVPTESVPSSCGMCGSYKYYNPTCYGLNSSHNGYATGYANSESRVVDYKKIPSSTNKASSSVQLLQLFQFHGFYCCLFFYSLIFFRKFTL